MLDAPERLETAVLTADDVARLAEADRTMLARWLADAEAWIRECVPQERSCAADYAGSVPLRPAKAAPWRRRATRSVLVEHAGELAGWSDEHVLVTSDIPVSLPRRHRSVASRAIGEQMLLRCGRERLLLVVLQHETSRLDNGSVMTDLTVVLVGATCDRPDRRIFEHGADFYRVVFAGSRIDIFRTRMSL